jgi:hypothetical protein
MHTDSGTQSNIPKRTAGLTVQTGTIPHPHRCNIHGHSSIICASHLLGWVQIKEACEDTGFFCISGHQCTPGALEAVFHASRPFFDLPKSRKLDYVVRDMRAGRGYEVSSEHREYEKWLEACAIEDEQLAFLLQVCPACLAWRVSSGELQ